MNIKNVLIVILLIFPFDALAEKLSFGLVEDLHPYSYMENNQWVGNDVEIANEIFRLLGVKIEYSDYPWARLITMLTLGGIDGMPGLYCNLKELKKYENIEFSEPIYESRMSLYALKERHMKITSLDDLRGKSVGIIRGYIYGPEFENYKGFDKQVSVSDKMLSRQLAWKRIDVAAVEDGTFLYYSKILGFRKKFERIYVLNAQTVCMGFSKKVLDSKTRIKVDNVNKIIRQLKENGFIQKIFEKYLY